MVADLIRDSAFGHLVRLVSKGKLFPYDEEKDPALWRKYLNETKSGHAAYHGKTEAPEGDVDELTQARGLRAREGNDSEASSRTEVAEGFNEASGVRVDPEKGKDVNIIDWTGDDDAHVWFSCAGRIVSPTDDRQNPRNWSRAKKYFVTAQVVLLTFSVYIGSAIYTAGIQDVMLQFGVAQVPATLGLTLYVAGYGLGPLIWSPMSEVPQIGRLWVYIGTLCRPRTSTIPETYADVATVVFVLLQFPVIYASNFGMMLAFRFLTGFFGSPALATGGATIADMYRPQKQAYGLAIWGVGAVCGPTLAPLLSGFAVQAKGWTWSIWELTWLSAFTWVVLFFLLPETSSPNILHRRTRRLRKMTGNDKLTCEPDMMSAEMGPKEVSLLLF